MYGRSWRTASSGSRCATTAWAERSPARGRASSACATASRRWAARSSSSARRAAGRRCTSTSRSTAADAQRVASGERRRRSDRAQAVERLALDLATALLADAEPPADLLVALDTAAVDAVAPGEHVAVPARQQE